MDKKFIYTGQAIFDETEIQEVVEVLRKGRLGLSQKGREFEKKFARYITSDHCILTNSGSSASLLALDAMKHLRNLKEGEIITPACGFPTTVNPIFQLGFKPVFVDVDKTYNLTPEFVESAISKDTVGVMFAHTLGNPAKIGEIAKIANEKGLFLIEDCCDAYGGTYKGKMCGSFGNLATYSFYPAHGITLGGEGGAVTTSDRQLDKIIRSLRDWGKDCYCDAWQDNRCGKRFDHEIDGVVYDHKYTFARLGYNLKPTEMQAAFGLVQLTRLDSFNSTRRRNFKLLYERLEEFRGSFEYPEINFGADPVFFGFPLMIKDNKINRKDFVGYLNIQGIGTRFLFGGDLTKQPAYQGKEYKVSGNLEMTRDIFRNLFWIGVHPAISEQDIEFIGQSFKNYFQRVK